MIDDGEPSERGQARAGINRWRRNFLRWARDCGCGDRLGAPVAERYDGTISTLYIFAWFLGTGLASGLGAEAAQRIAATFNRVGLIILMVSPVVLLAVVMLFAWGSFSPQTMTAVIFSFIGTGVGLGRSRGELMKSKAPRS